MTREHVIACPTLVGRAQHLSGGRQLVHAAQSGRGQIALIAGEAGVGKSRLAADVCAYAATQGFLIVQGHCYQPALANPFALLLDLVRSQFASHPTSLAAPATAAIVRELCQLLPGLLPLPADAAPSAAALDPAEKKRRLFALFDYYLTHHAAQQPLLVLLEDLHWSDDSSLEFLQQRARQLAAHPIMLLATYRSDEPHAPLRQLLAFLDRERLAHEFTLQRLPRDDIAAMLQAIFALDRPVQIEFLDLIEELTDGNPFFIEEVLKSLVVAGDIFYGDQGWDRKPLTELHIPRSVQEAVQQRAARLGATARRVLDLAAIAGQRFDWTLLQAVTQLGERELMRAMKALIAAQLVFEESAEDFAFRHALTRQAIAAGLLARERQALHRQIAETIARIHTEELPAYLGDLAYHYAEAADWEQTLAYARRAGEHAQAVNAPRAAVEQFTRALRAAGQLGLAPDAGLLHARARAYEMRGDFEAARADYEVALAEARLAGNQPLEWQALLDLGHLWAARDYARTGDYYREAQSLAERMGDAARLAQGRNRQGNWYVNIDRPHEGLRLHHEALAYFERAGDPHGLAETLDLLGMASYQVGDMRASAEHYERAVALFRELDDPHGLASCLTTLALATGTYFNATVVPPPLPPAEIERALAEAVGLARSLDAQADLAYASLIRGGWLGLRGDYSSGLAAARASLDAATMIGHHQWMAGANAVLGALWLDVLALSEARQHLEQALQLADATGSGLWVCYSTGLLGMVCVAQGDYARAEAVLSAVPGAATSPQLVAHRVCCQAQAQLALAQGDFSVALRIADELWATALHRWDASDLPHLAYLRGAILAAQREHEEALGAFDSAAQGAELLGLRPLQWRVQVARGALLQAGGQEREAAAVYAAARAHIQALAASLPDESLRERFLAQAEELFPQPGGRDTAAPGNLTARETEVTQLVAQGYTNREIAARLVVSERTVESHVSNILAKCGFTSRAQIAAWATAVGLANLPAPQGLPDSVLEHR